MQTTVIRSMLVLLLAGCAPGGAPAGAAVAGPAAQPGERVIPVADYHTHLFRREAISRVFGQPLPPVQVPDDVAQLLAERARRWNDAAALAAMYTEDGLALTSRNQGWLRGPGAIAGYLSQLFAGPYRITPTSFGADGSTGYVAGYYSRDAEEGVRHIGHAHLALRRGPDGTWRIATETGNFPGPRTPDPVTAARLIAQLDTAGIQRAVVLSTAYWFGSALGEASAEEHANVRAENDWIAQQVSAYPDRLVGFCSFNPLREYALEELARCAAHPHIRGLKLHFGDSDVNVRNPDHLQKARAVFRAANAHRMPITVDLMTRDPEYGAEHSRIFLNSLVTAAPDIPIQVAHLAGSGPGYNSDAAFAVFAEAAAAGDPRMKNVYTDVATVVTLNQQTDALPLIARRLREFGVERVLYGSDTPASLEYTPESGWLFFRRVPLTDEEFRIIARNVAPSLR